MAPPFEIVSADNRGPTDNSGLDTLWVVWLQEGGNESERFLFSVSDRVGVPSEVDLRTMIEQRAAGFANDESAVAQFRAREVPHRPQHPERRAVLLGYRD